MTDDEMWTRLRAEVATADLDATTAAELQRHAHARLRNPHRPLSTVVRAAESLAVTGIAIAQIAWAWSIVLG